MSDPAAQGHPVLEQRQPSWVESAVRPRSEIRSELEQSLGRLLAELPRVRDRGDDLGVSRVLTSMARIHVKLREWDFAEECFSEAEESLKGLRENGARKAIEVGRAELELYRGDLDAARALLERAVADMAETGETQALAEATTLLGIAHRKAGEAAGALERLREAAELGRASGDRLVEAEAESERALVLQAEGRNQEALESLVRARQLFEQLRLSTAAHGLRRRLEQMERNHLQLVEAWGESIESKDHYTAGHCDRVARYTCMLAEALDFPVEDLKWLRIGAFLHDVGKTAVPAEVLNKPGKLTAAEWELMKRHTVVGDEMVAELHFPWDVRPIVRSHHEHWDGGGYPDGLAGTDIPLTARILCVADVFDALTTNRSYRRALSRAEALEIMAGEVGSTLDPSLFTLFSNTIHELEETANDPV
jgi:putative nucleotidyltransferase with HDIG domain